MSKDPGLTRPFEVRVGARGRSRTGTAVRPRDFKSLASTSFATRAIYRHCNSSVCSVVRRMSVGILVLVVTNSQKQIPIWSVASDSWVNSNLSGDNILITDSRLRVDAPYGRLLWPSGWVRQCLLDYIKHLRVYWRTIIFNTFHSTHGIRQRTSWFY